MKPQKKITLNTHKSTNNYNFPRVLLSILIQYSDKRQQTVNIKKEIYKDPYKATHSGVALDHKLDRLPRLAPDVPHTTGHMS